MRPSALAVAVITLLVSHPCRGQDGVELVLGLQCAQGGFEADGAVDCDELAAAIRDEFTEGTVALVQLSAEASGREADLTVSVEITEGTFILILEDALIEHEYRREIPSAEGVGFDPDAAAFILRGLLSSFLYEDLEDIPAGSDLVEIAVPPGKHEVLKLIIEAVPAVEPAPVVEPERSIPPMGVEAGYMLLVDPSNRLALHGLIAAFGIRAAPWLDVHAGIVLTAPKAFSQEAPDASGSYDLTISHVKGSLGARFRPLRLKIFTLEAGFGLHVGAVRLEVEESSGSALWSFNEIESAVNASVGFHLGILRMLGLRITVGVEGVLNATGVKPGPGSTGVLYDPGRFRLAITAGLTAGL